MTEPGEIQFVADESMVEQEIHKIVKKKIVSFLSIKDTLINQDNHQEGLED